MNEVAFAGVPSLTVPILGSVGSGPTVLAAFDDALVSAGVANYNLVRLSSVIPPGTAVLQLVDDDPTGGSRRHRGARAGGESADSSALGGVWGDRLYAVWAFEGAQVLGQEAWAGVGWVQDPEDGRGLFVEHEGGSEAQVREELRATLSAISSSRGLSHLEQQTSVVGTRCEGAPVGALVIAPFAVEPWGR